jgi:hypothetical protein
MQREGFYQDENYQLFAGEELLAMINDGIFGSRSWAMFCEVR